MERQRAKPLVLALAVLAALAGLYELAAVATDAVPTISEGVWAIPLVARVLLVGAAAGAAVDHFITRRWL